MPQLRYLTALLLFWLAQLACAQNFVPVPPLTAHVTDRVGMLTPQQRQALENVLLEYEKRTGSQIAIVLLSKTEPEAIEQYGIRVADAWKLGRKGVDDGVILLVAKDNPSSLRRLRIEAGRGVQGVLTDAQSEAHPAGRDRAAFPPERLLRRADGRRIGHHHPAGPGKVPAPQGAQGERGAQDDEGLGGWLPLLFFVFMVFVMMSRARSGRRRFSRNGWGTAAGVILGSHIGRGGFGDFGGGGGGGGFGGGGGGFSGGGGGFDGGGASGDW